MRCGDYHLADTTSSQPHGLAFAWRCCLADAVLSTNNLQSCHTACLGIDEIHLARLWPAPIALNLEFEYDC